MDFNQLLDSLTAHLALYHSSIPRSSPSPPSNPRQSILRWFSSLTPPQRQAALTTVDQNWTSLLLQMQTRLSKSGHGFFMLLPDFPSQIPPFLPSLCFRKSSGLLARVSASNNAERSIFNSVRIFASQEGERIGDCSCSLDSITVSEDFVRDLDRFVAAMDGLSNGSFLSGESPAFGSWEELPWLKSKGYYSIESFVANKLELALRLSWIHCHGKKRGAKSKGLSNVAGVASNLFWRKKGCLDWWAGLEPGLRKKIFRLVTAKAAKCLANEIVKGSNDVLKDDMWFFSRGLEHAPWYGSTAACGIIHAVSGIDAEFHLGMMPAPSSGKPSSLATISNCLLVLQEMSALILAFQDCEFETEELFFSPLGPVNTVSDRILRSVRGFLMHASSDCIKLELLGDENSKVTPNKSKEKFAASSQKGKSKGQRAKKLNSRAKSRQAGLSPEIPSKDGSGNLQKVPSVEANRKTPAVNAGNPVKDLCKESELSGMVMEPAKGSVDCEAQITCKKRGKANSKGKRENPSLQGPVTSMDTQTLIMDWCVTSEGSASPSTSNMDLEHQNHGDLTDSALAMVVSSSPNLSGPLVSVDKTPPLQNEEDNVRGNACSTGSTSYEWPSLGHVHLTSHNSQHLPAATDRLHLDVGRNWRNHFQHSFISTTSLDWPPAVRSVSRLSSSLAYNFDSGFIPRVPTSFRSGEAVVDSCGSKNAQDLSDDCESHWIYEEESEVLALSGRDYNQFFGGGVMYWNTSDHVGTGFSRPPSLSSEDSSWAWHEADLNRAIDDMVGLPGLPPSYCATVPDAAAEEKVSGLLTNSSVGVVEGMAGDSLSYPILRPIVIPSISRKGTRSEFMVSHGIKSPCVPCTRREPPRIKRPQSPVVLCVPQARRPPPPSPVCESKKQRGFPTVRSGSSSPRHWGMRNWSHDETNGEEPRLCVDGAEVVWPSWRNKGLTTTPMMQPLPGSLLHDRLIAISQLGLDQEHPDVAFPLQSPDLLNCPARKMSLSTMHSILHEEIDSFCKQVASQNQTRKPYINWAVKRVARLLQVLWPRSRTNIFGSNATGLALPSSDVDLVVCLPPVRNLEPIKEAGILEGRNGIKETCLQHAARYLANQEWVKNDSLKTIENTTIPVIMLVAEVPHDLIASNGTTSMLHMSKDVSAQMVGGERTSSVCETSFSESCSESMCSQRTGGGMDMRSVRLDISFESPSHTGLQTTELVRWFTEQFPPAIPLALVLKQFLADRSLDHSYSGGLSSYCLVLLITRFLQHEHHIGRLVNQNLGSLLMDFLYFFGNVFDPRQMRISVQGSGVYINRERGHSIDPIHIDDPLYPANNVGRNCFRIHQCIKYMAQAFADAYSILENELTSIPVSGDPSKRTTFSLLSKIILSINPG